MSLLNKVPADKLFFRIGEVAKYVEVPAHVIRFWETEFDAIRPKKSPSSHRLYRRRDVETILVIKRLLYEEGYTIAGARRRLVVLKEEAAGIVLSPATGLSAVLPEEKKKSLALVPASPEQNPLEVIREELESLLRFLDEDEKDSS